MFRPSKHALKPAIAYLRVSTKKQGRDGQGHELQKIAIDEYVRHAGYKIVRTFEDAETGMGEDSIRERKGVIAAIELSRKEEWPILVDGLDRFSRNTHTVEVAIKSGRLKLISCQLGENASNAVIMSQAVRAQHHGELISRKTTEALQQRKEQGVQLGNPVNLDIAQKKGAAANKALAQERAREMAPVVQELRDAGRTSARAIAEGLNVKGFRTPQGKDWTGGNVRSLLELVNALDDAEKHADNLADPNWGAW